MAKQRMINTKFWVDAYVSNLDPSEKLLFLYFLTNPYTDICGIYEVPLKHVALETGLDKEMVIKILARFTRDGKIFYEDGWVAIKNFAKHQLENPKVKKGIEIGLSKAPKTLIDSLSIDYDSLSHLNSNSNSNPNKTAATAASEKISHIISLFKEVNPSFLKWFGNTSQRSAVDRMITAHGMEKIEKVIALLPKTNQLPYFPSITTPVQLEDKWAQLESTMLRKKNELTSKSNNFII